MEVKIRYLGYDIAEMFGSQRKREVVQISDDATYNELLGLLEKKYVKAEPEEEVADNFFFICGGKPLNAIGDKPINPEVEVMVAHKVFGG
jgi:hypothetical protein